ncbi:MAG: SDR family oxidoreductase, partial [Actinobacteria bacterium]|nr:SDR family oxidoreductase [Actinomycetota bacterium]
AAAELPEGVGLTVDVASEEDTVRMAEEAVERCGGIDVLVNNAGLYASLAMRPFTEIPLEEWRRVMDVNVASMFLTCRAVVPRLRERGGGRIVNISSGTPFRGVPLLLHYVTSKGAIVAFTRALAKELGADGVLVNCVAPGFTLSEGVRQNPEVIERLRDVSVSARTIQRDQEPADVVGAVVFLAGPGSSFVTGQTIVIDGGQTFH